MPRNRVLKIPGGILGLWGFQIRLIRNSLRVWELFSRRLQRSECVGVRESRRERERERRRVKDGSSQIKSETTKPRVMKL